MDNFNPDNAKSRGGISVETAHIFPIIKKWLYSEKDIFLREIVSNAADAVTKHRRLISLGQIEDDESAYRITVRLDKTARTLTVEDNGIGMTEEELIRYLGNIALSGALDFINKYEGENENPGGIIGHFGLGFYSAFMVADTVEVVTRSYTDSPAVRWICNSDGSYELFGSDRADRGTCIIMHISEEEGEYLDSGKIRAMLDKYCSFMPTEIYFVNEDDDATRDSAPVNDTHPLWQKAPSECTDEEYKAFYRKVFSDYREPLFYIHINADYPLNFKGILYCPRFTNEYEPVDGQVKLYYNQVFVADNIKEVIPEYLFMLRGVLDCPELPLNVSRSYLQNNAYVSKVSAHISKKVADKLCAMCDTDRENYDKIWDSIRTFVEYACMRDRKFYDRAKDALLIKLTDGTTQKTSEYLEACKDNHENTVYYASDREAQAQYISMLEAEGIKVALFDKAIDSQFMQMMENYEPAVKYQRIDSDIADVLKSEGDSAEDERLVTLFRRVADNDALTVKFQSFKDERTPAMLTVSEQSRRMEEMMRIYSMQGGDADGLASFPLEYTLTLNTSSPIIKKLSGYAAEDDGKHKAELIASQIYRLTLLSQRKLTADELKGLLDGSFELLSRI
ncbi:MAG: molecular chaperone HtpG [Ruminococcaceae bacterium]|nr:molecular chaperone HtpG [Oscillospiraceae bacterium]